MRLLRTASNALLPRKRVNAMSTASGMPGTQAMTAEASENLREVPAMNQTSGSPEMRR